MILVVFGTTGELIKLAPVLLRLEERRAPFVLATTGQQVEQIPAFLDQLGLRPPDLWLARGASGRDLRVNRDIPGWLWSATHSYARHRRGLRRQLLAGPGRPLLLVHGDTMTTVLAAVMGRGLRVSVAHIESGLRSYDYRHPFPEELNRRVASAIASLHYAPGAWAASNLRRGHVVDTGSNTIRDSLALVPTGRTRDSRVPNGPYGVVSLHRFELLNDRRKLTQTVEALAESAERTPLLFVDHSVTVAAIERFGLGCLFDEARFVRLPRLRFFDFVTIERSAAFVVTDSGGSQEECFYLDVPCLVHRLRTERREGLGETSVLSGLRVEVLRDFLADPGRFRRRTALPAASPSDVIVRDLERRGFAAPST
ncbi:MAG: UDP-N-acetylglucosamine 2-epimerase [Actinobacteria bacterium]|nr:UDP-N-acetylglucosamine 2-epimerase [Actinomycetota bacterium]